MPQRQPAMWALVVPPWMDIGSTPGGLMLGLACVVHEGA